MDFIPTGASTLLKTARANPTTGTILSQTKSKSNKSAHRLHYSRMFSTKCIKKKLNAIFHAIPDSKKKEIAQKLAASSIDSVPVKNQKAVFVIKCGVMTKHKNGKETDQGPTKWLVGETKQMRLPQHLSHSNKAWLRDCDSLVLEYLLPKTKDYRPSNVTKAMMVIKGVDQVRGPSFSKPNLTKKQLQSLAREFCAKFQICFVCHQRGHLQANCIKSKFKPHTCRSNSFLIDKTMKSKQE